MGMKNIVLILLLNGFLMFKRINGEHDCELEASPHSHEVLSPENVILRKLSKHNEVEVSVNLKKMSHTHLANENLPIWIALSSETNKLESANHVMEDVGPFVTYQDANNCSAAVYFSKRRYFDGTIDNRYYMHHVPYDIRTKQVKSSTHNMIPTEWKHPVKQSLDQITNETPRGVYEGEAVKVEMDKWKFVQSNLPFPNTVYIETLVMVNYDMLEHFEDYTSLVRYILTTFNSVDMIYSKIDKPKIKINLAGIIIGDTRKSFSQIAQNCYEKYDEHQEGLNAACVTDGAKKILESYEQKIPLDSYDVVVFLTNFEMHGYHRYHDKLIAVPLEGYADTPENGVYDGYRLSSQQTRVAVAFNSHDYYQVFTVIAHELAHLMNVFHDEGEFRDSHGVCKANLMRTDGSYCRKCLFFDDRSLEQLKRFFSSRDGCIFHNEPKSLYEQSSAPKLFWDEHQQCQCYGYELAYNLDTSLWKRVETLWKKQTDCHERLKCVTKKSLLMTNIFDTAYRMSGTPCYEKNGVCWRGKCSRIDDGKVIDISV